MGDYSPAKSCVNWHSWYDELDREGIDALMYIPPRWGKLQIPGEIAYAIWALLMDACDAYFVRGESAWAPDPRAPEKDDDVILRYFEQLDGYRSDTGAMAWDGPSYYNPGTRTGNRERPYAYDMTALPIEWKRSLVSRIWCICEDMGLREHQDWMRQAQGQQQRGA